MSESFNEKVRQVIAEAIAGLDPDDRAERIAYCREHDEHGVRAKVEGEGVEFTWGGKLLAVVERALLTNDDLEMVAGQRIEPVPDTIPEEWGDGLE
jgi:hypothetical protein